MAFSLARFERLTFRREHEAACRELLALLAEIDAGRGQMPSCDGGGPDAVTPREQDRHLCTRIAAAAASLLSDPGLQFSRAWHPRVLGTQRWLSALFAATPFGHADHVIRALSNGTPDDPSAIAIAPRELVKFCLLYSAESALPLDIGALWQHDHALAAGLAIALLSPRLLATPAAHGKREQILPWLAAHLDAIDDLDDVPGDVLHDAYMHCSYADRPDKHDVKRAINRLIGRTLQRRELGPRPLPARRADGDKPVLLVVLEWFTSGHSIYRTHSLAIEAAREQFQVVGIGLAAQVDARSLQVFDEFVALPDQATVFEQLQQIRAEAEHRRAAVLYMPSVGMFPLTMFLANLRVAPLQAAGLGHPATLHALATDLVVVEDDYVGDPACFSETLLRLPADAMPYRPGDAEPPTVRVPPRPLAPATVMIAVCAAAMKLNPRLLAACAEIAARVTVRVHFHLLVGQAHGLMVPPLVRLVSRYLGTAATVWPEQPRADYLALVASCDMFVNPFPFGNTNGTIDCVAAGLVGVCKTGPEVHEHIDEGMFRRLGMPEWLIARSVEDYIQAAVRLVQSHAERAELRRCLSGPDKVAVFYAGRPQLMGRMLRQALEAQCPV